MDCNCGYFNCNTGKIVIPAIKAPFRYGWQFNEVRAFVVLHDEDYLSVIDYSGKVIARNVAEYKRGYEYVFVDGLCNLRKNGKDGLLPLDGTWAVEPKSFRS